MVQEKHYLTALLFLSALIGYLLFKLNCRKKDDIIKLLIRRDLLPAPAPTTEWTQGGVCYMGDGSIGRVDGKYCMQIAVI